MAPEVALGAEDAGEDYFAASRARSAANPPKNPGSFESRHPAQGGIKRSSKVSSDTAAEIRRNRPSASDVAEYERGGSQPLGQSGGSFRAGHSVRAARAVSRVSMPSLPNVTGAVATPSGRSNLVMRLVVALGVAIVALEAASYVSGRYFSWDLKSGAQRIQDAGTMIGLYPGQQAKIQSAVVAAKASPLPPPTAAPYASHGMSL